MNLSESTVAKCYFRITQKYLVLNSESWILKTATKNDLLLLAKALSEELNL